MINSKECTHKELAIKALEFYASEENHDDCKKYCENCLNSAIDYDRGRLAREILEVIK